MPLSFSRTLEPVIVTGAEVPLFQGTSVDDIFVYRWTGVTWEQIPFQVDEVAAGAYVSVEDGTLDADDEIVFMAQDLGSQAPDAIANAVSVNGLWYEVEVTNPLNTSEKGWAYVARSSTLSVTNPTDYADFDGSQTVTATAYAATWSSSHGGLDDLKLYGGSDILDRTKIRARYRIFGIPGTATEETLPAPPLTLVRDGAVRVVLQRGTAWTLAYGAMLSTETTLDLSGIPGLVIEEARMSTDLNSAAVGGTYYNENVPAGVTIDGTPDSVPGGLSHAWRQVSLDDGTMVQVIDPDNPGGTLSHYYKDDSTIDPDDTGDQQSYGDSGLKVTNPTVKVLTVHSVQYILAGRQGNRGEEFYQNFHNPLQVSTRLQALHHSYGVIIRHGSE